MRSYDDKKTSMHLFLDVYLILSNLHNMWPAIQKQCWSLLDPPPPPPRSFGPAAGGRIHATPLPKVARHILEVLTEVANDIKCQTSEFRS